MELDRAIAQVARESIEGTTQAALGIIAGMFESEGIRNRLFTGADVGRIIREVKIGHTEHSTAAAQAAEGKGQ